MVGSDQVSRVAAGEKRVECICGSDSGFRGVASCMSMGNKIETLCFILQSSFLSTPISPHYLTTGIVCNLSLAITILCAARGENKIL